MQERVQRFGGNLAAMVIPNIGAFIAWGLITAFRPRGPDRAHYVRLPLLGAARLAQ